MRFARKLVLLALTVGAFMALTAGSALGAEVVNEATGVHCSAVSETNGGNPEISGGCPIKGASIGEIEWGGPFGTMTRCNISIEGRISEGGRIIGTWTVGTCSAGSFEPCTVMAEKHLSVQIGSKIVPSNPEAWSQTTTFCFDAEEPIDIGEIECTLPGTVTQSAHNNIRLVYGSGVPSGAHQACTIPAGYSFSGTILNIIDAAHPAIEVLD